MGRAATAPPDVSEIASVKKVPVTASVPAASGPPFCSKCLAHGPGVFLADVQGCLLERLDAAELSEAVHGYVVHVQDTATSARAPGNKMTSVIVRGISRR